MNEYLCCTTKTIAFNWPIDWQHLPLGPRSDCDFLSEGGANCLAKRG